MKIYGLYSFYWVDCKVHCLNKVFFLSCNNMIKYIHPWCWKTGLDWSLTIHIFTIDYSQILLCDGYCRYFRVPFLYTDEKDNGWQWSWMKNFTIVWSQCLPRNIKPKWRWWRIWNSVINKVMCYLVEKVKISHDCLDSSILRTWFISKHQCYDDKWLIMF